MDGVYVIYIQFGFPMNIMLYEFPIFVISFKLIHKKAEGLKRVKSLDAGM